VIKPLPTKDPRQEEHTKQSLCQCLPSNEIKRVPPMPENLVYMQAICAKIHAYELKLLFCIKRALHNFKVIWR